MIGGQSTFDTSWQDSRLEQLLPVTFAGNIGVQGLDKPFRIELTEEALQHQVFQVGDNQPVMVFLNLDVITADPLVVELDGVSLFAADAHGGGELPEDAALVHAVDDLERGVRHSRFLSPAPRLSRRARRASYSTPRPGSGARTVIPIFPRCRCGMLEDSSGLPPPTEMRRTFEIPATEATASAR